MISVLVVIKNTKTFFCDHFCFPNFDFYLMYDPKRSLKIKQYTSTGASLAKPSPRPTPDTHEDGGETKLKKVKKNKPSLPDNTK